MIFVVVYNNIPFSLICLINYVFLMFKYKYYLLILITGIERLCEGESKDIRCPGGAIAIRKAKYGRWSYFTCGFSFTTKCERDVTMTLHKMCDGQAVCKVTAQTSLLGDPCRGVKKYLEFDYACFAAGLYFLRRAAN